MPSAALRTLLEGYKGTNTDKKTLAELAAKKAPALWAVVWLNAAGCLLRDPSTIEWRRCSHISNGSRADVDCFLQVRIVLWSLVLLVLLESFINSTSSTDPHPHPGPSPSFSILFSLRPSCNGWVPSSSFPRRAG